MSNQSTLNEFGGSDTNGQLAGSDPGDEKLYRNEEWLQEQYWEQEKTTYEIADELGVSQKTITNWMDKHEIERRSITEIQTDGDLKRLKNEEWLREQYCEQEKTTYEIANELGLAQGTVRTWMDNHGIDRRSTAESLTDGDLKRLKNEEWLREQYCEQKKTTYEIADELGLAKTTVLKWMREHGIERRGRSEARTDGDVERLKNEEWLREQYCERQRTVREIANELNLSPSPVQTWMQKHGIERRLPAESQTDGDIEPLKNEQWLREQYCEQEKTLREIADELGVSQRTITNWMDKHEIERRTLSESHTDGDVEPLKNEEWLREQYHEQQKTTYQIANELDLSQTTTGKWLDIHDIERRESHTDGDVEPLKNEEWLREQYCEQRKATTEIANELNLGSTTVRRWMIEHGIERRSPAESQTDGDLERLKNEGWLRKQYCEHARSSIEIAEELDLSPGTVRGWLSRHDIEIRSLYMDPDHLSHRVIGELELEVANCLHETGVDYEYESLEIEHGETHTYTPDFVTSNYVIECKGIDWGKKYNKRFTAEQKAEAAMKQLDGREYVVVGMQLPCDIHIPREEHGTIQELFE